MIEKWVEKLDKTLIVAPSSEHPFFLMLRNKFPNISFSLTTKEELIKNYYGSCPNDYFYTFIVDHPELSLVKAKLFFSKLNYPIEEYEYNDLEENQVVNEIRKSEKKKVLEIYKYRQELIEKGVIKPKKYYVNLLKKQKIYLFGYLKDDREISKIFSNENVSFELLDYPYKTQNKEVLYFEHIDQEVEFVMHKIKEIYKEKGEGVLNKIFLYSPSKEYYYPLIKLARDYDIPLEDYQGSNYYNLSCCKEIIDYYFKNKTIDDYETKSEIENIIVEDIKLLVEKFGLFVDSNRFSYILKHYFTHKKLPKIRYQEQLSSTSRIHFLDDEYVFVLGFEHGKFPVVRKNDDYFLDETKEAIGLIRSDESNKLERQKIESLIFANKNVFISCKHKSIDGVHHPSTLITAYKLELKQYVHPLTYYSFSYAKKEYARVIDFDSKYGTITYDRTKYSVLGDILYRSYNSDFGGSNFYKEFSYIEHSYSSLEKFAKCPYYYYLDSVLKLQPFKETFATKFGNFAHKVMQYALVNKDFETSYDKAYQEYKWSIKEDILLLQTKKYLENLYSLNIEHLARMGSYSLFLELKMKREISTYASLIGTIDKLIITDDQYYAIVDYKTGSASFEAKKLQHGFSMQLPIYGLLIDGEPVDKKCTFVNRFKFVGAYIQPILPSSALAKSKQLIEDIQKIQMLCGPSSDEMKRLEAFDKTFRSSKYIRSMSVTQKGSFNSHSQIVSDELWEQYLAIVMDNILDFDEKIRSNQFDISPVKLDDEEPYCKRCPYKNICYVTSKQINYKSTKDDRG